MLANRLQVLGDHFDDKITVKQWLLIAGISKSKSTTPTISEVATFIGNSRQNVKKMALILEREGFLTLYKDQNDARVLRIKLTQNCIDYFNHRYTLELDFLEQLYDGFDSNLTIGLFNGLKQLSENIIKLEAHNQSIEKE